MAEYDFEKAWKDVEAAQMKNLPRTATNKLDEIVREAVAASRWPDAARALLSCEQAKSAFTDGESRPDEWLPAFAASVDAQPAPLQAVMQLRLAHTYLENSRPWRLGGAAPTKLDDDAAKDKMPPWSLEKICSTLETQFEKVLAFEAELKAQKLADWKALFDQGTLPESFCPTLYDFAVRDMIEFYGSTIPDKTLEKGRAIYDRLVQFHREDGNLDARAMAEINRAEYTRAFSQIPRKKRDAAFKKAMDDIMTRFEDETSAVAFAAANKARVLQDEGELVAAHSLAAEYAAKWPDAPGGRSCANIVAEIESKSLDVKTERNWCAPWPQIEVSARNVVEVFFRLVPVTFDELVADRSMGGGGHYSSDSRSAMRDRYLKRAPAKEWSEKLGIRPDYSEQKFVFPVPDDLPSGHYVLYAASNGKFGADKLPLYSQYVTVTSLALVMETGNGKFGGTVCRAESGEPVAAACVELWGYPEKGGRLNVLRETYATDEEGRFAAEVDRTDRHNALSRHVRVVKDGDEVLSLGSEGSGGIYDEDTEYEHVDLFTDRSLYRPGQEIKVKGIAYHADPRLRYFHTHQFTRVLVSLKDPNGKEVASKKLVTNKWGSFAETFTAPLGRITGAYSVVARVEPDGASAGEDSKHVNVEEYKRPKFTAELGKASEKAALGESVTITGKAVTYSGLPVQSAKVEWSVERRTCYPSWWRWFGVDDDDGDNFVAKGEAETDENGVFKITFTPVASPTADLAGDPSFDFTVSATVTDGTGEARSATESFEIGTVAWRANVWTDGSWHTPGKSVTAKVSLSSLAGTKVPVKGTLRVVRLKQPERPVRKTADDGNYYGDKKSGPWDWKSWESGEEVLSVEANGEKPDKWATELKLDAGAYRLVFETKDPKGKTVKDIEHVIVFDPSGPIGVNVPDFFCVEDHYAKVGGALRAYWGTGYETGYCRVKVTSNGKVIADDMVGSRVQSGRPFWRFELPLKDEHRGEMRIEATFVRENRVYHNHDVVNVPWNNKCLDITAEHLTSKLNPGREETWTFKVSGPAEVLAFMYDRSLGAYKWHDVSLGFSSHFTPWTRYLSSPQIQNDIVTLSHLAGAYPSRSIPFSATWPRWRTVTWRRGFGMGRNVRMKSLCGSRAPASQEAAAMVEYEDEVVLSKEAPLCAEASPCETSAEPGAADAPRRNLQETAFFFPNLETDAEGMVSLAFTVPDALTGWKFLMVAHDNELDGGVYRNDEIVTTKPLMCEPNAPRFVREGDDFMFAVKVTNTDDSPQSGEVELRVCELGVCEFETGSHSSTPPLPSSSTCRFSLASHESRVFEFRLSIPDGCGYLKYVAKAKGEKFADGEEGILPVLSRRVLVREAVQLNARGGETNSFKFANLLASGGSETIRHQDLTVCAVSRPAWYAVLSLPYLMEYPHECCEQTFSRFYANALGSFIANADPRIREMFDDWKAAGAEALKSPLETNPHLKAVALESTPWVRDAEHETAARARLGTLFEKGRLEGEQARCMEKLRLERNGDGLWPWFPGGPSSDGISLYILVGFARLNHLAGQEYPDFFAPAAESLDFNVSEDVKRRLELEKKGFPFSVNGFDIRWMYLHSFNGVAPAKDKTAVPLFVSHLRDEWTALGLEPQALAAVALKRMGEAALANEIMASIKERGVLSDELGMYWKVPYFFSSSVFAAPVSTQALIVEAFREVTGDEESADACGVWLLKQKQTQDWTTTAATADAIYALMLGGGTDLLAGDSLAEVTLGGVKVDPASGLTGKAAVPAAKLLEPGTGMYSVRYAADSVKPEMGEITFSGAGGKGVSWGGVHWSYFEDVLKVRAHEPKELSVEKRYYKKVAGPEGTRLSVIEGALKPGDEIVARLEIKSDRTYEFVHLSDERPACAEPVDVLSSYRWRDGVGYYQSTRDTATHYYIDRLNKGVFVLETSYRVQQRGVFTGGIATIQCMYAPEFTAHSTAETVRVGK